MSTPENSTLSPDCGIDAILSVLIDGPENAAFVAVRSKHEGAWNRVVALGMEALSPAARESKLGSALEQLESAVGSTPLHRADDGECCVVIDRVSPEEGRLSLGVLGSPSSRPWEPHTLERLATAIDHQLQQRVEAQRLRREIEELRRQESKYHSIFDNVVEGIYQTSPEGKYISVNRMLAEIYGYDDPNELVDSVSNIERELYVDPERREEFIRRLDSESTISDFESEVFRRDGKRIWISENARRVTNDTGELLYYEGTVQDISLRKAAEKGLKDSEALYHSLVENISQNIFRKDIRGEFTFANTQFCRTLGRDLDEIVGRTDYDFFPDALAEKYVRDDQQVLTTLKPLEATEVYQDSAGERLYVHVIKTPLYSANGEIIGIQGIFHDVTLQKKTEAALAFERDLHQALMASSPDRIYYKNVDLKYIKLSRAFVRDLGYQYQEQAIGKTDYDIFPKDKAEEYQKEDLRIIRSGRPMINKEEKGSGEHSENWALVTKFPIFNAKGETTGVVGILRDISRLKGAEIALERARDEALESARVKAEFLANVSHEIRTPMNAIIGNTELLLQSRLSPEQQELAQASIISAESLQTMMNDILDFSKLEAGKLRIESIPVDLNNLIDETLEIFVQTTTRKGIELFADQDPTIPEALRGDPVRIRQILINLINNAVKFTQCGEIRIETSLISAQDGIASVRFAVSDTGIGIRAEVIPMLFQAFTQADGSMARRFGGTGLGLAIIKSLIDLMGGHIHVESEPDQGSTFFFEIPFRCEVENGAHPQERARKSGGNVLHFVSWNQREAEAAARGAEGMGMRTSVEVLPYGSLPDNAIAPPPDTALLCLIAPASDPLDVETIETLKNRLIEPDRPPVALITTARAGEFSSILEPIAKVKLFKPLRQRLLQEALTTLRTESEPGPEPDETDVTDATQKARTKARILVAEDNPFNQKLVVRQFDSLGHKVTIVHDGEEALRALDEATYDLVFMDCQMPNMDGYTATREIRSRESSGRYPKRTRIIAMTANAMPTDYQRCVESGMDDYLPKPVRIRQLEVLLKEWDGAKPGGRPKETTQGAQETTLESGIDALDGAIIPLEHSPANPPNEGLQQLARLFVRDAKKRIAIIRDAIGPEAPEAVRNELHTLKGSARNLGAHRLAAKMEAFESPSHRETAIATEAIASGAEEELGAVIRALQERGIQFEED